MASLTVTIINGEATVVADGSAVSCKTAHDVEKAMGAVTKTVATGTKAAGTNLVQK